MSQEAFQKLAATHPDIIQAMEVHQEAFMDLMSKIRASMGNHLFSISMADEEGEILEPKKANEVNPYFNMVQNLMIGNFVLPFLMAQLPRDTLDSFEPLFEALFKQGFDIGDAYNQLKNMKAN